MGSAWGNEAGGATYTGGTSVALTGGSGGSSRGWWGRPCQLELPSPLPLVSFHACCLLLLCHCLIAAVTHLPYEVEVSPQPKPIVLTSAFPFMASESFHSRFRSMLSLRLPLHHGLLTSPSLH
jgi:hypothetical protein